jgi:hypothetical protein
MNKYFLQMEALHTLHDQLNRKKSELFDKYINDKNEYNIIIEPVQKDIDLVDDCIRQFAQ